MKIFKYRASHNNYHKKNIDEKKRDKKVIQIWVIVQQLPTTANMNNTSDISDENDDEPGGKLGFIARFFYSQAQRRFDL